MKKKKILFHSNCSKILSGFGKNARNVLTYLHKTGKYEVVELANSVSEDSNLLDLFPWKCIGTFPNDLNYRLINESKTKASKAAYGHYNIDKIIEQEKPDIYIGAEDIWAFNGFTSKKWWGMINTILWVTIDSSPILDAAITCTNETDHFLSWSSFAKDELLTRGAKQAKSLHGAVDITNFKKFNTEKKENLRAKHGITKDEFIIGFVFRNQLRKSVPNLLDGFIKFKNNNKKSKAKLLLHTGWQEGWDIPRLIKEKKINNKDILTCYYCKECKSYEIKPFQSDNKESGEEKPCGFCKSKKSQSTISVQFGPSEPQLNEIYNMMDVYCHPFTSGGQELPIQEAKLCELVTLVTDYSCGQDCSSESSGGFPLKWNEYREPGTQFIKASTCPDSISRQLAKVYRMNDQQRDRLGKTAREFVIQNYSTEKVCEKLMEIIDNCPTVEWDFDFSKLKPDPNYTCDKKLNDSDFVIDVYENILKSRLKKESEVFKYLLKKIQSGVTREKMTESLKANAIKEIKNSQKNSYSIKEHLDKNDDGKRIAIILEKSIGDVFMATSLLSNIKSLYPDYNIYFVTKPEYFPVLEGNPYIHRVVPFNKIFMDVLKLEGYSNRTDFPDDKGFFEIAIILNIQNQIVLNYTRNAKDKIQLELCT